MYKPGGQKAPTFYVGIIICLAIITVHLVPLMLDSMSDIVRGSGILLLLSVRPVHAEAIQPVRSDVGRPGAVVCRSRGDLRERRAVAARLEPRVGRRAGKPPPPTHHATPRRRPLVTAPID